MILLQSGDHCDLLDTPILIRGKTLLATSKNQIAFLLQSGDHCDLQFKY